VPHPRAGATLPRAMDDPRIRLWPGVPDLPALGVREFSDLMGDSPRPVAMERAELVYKDAVRQVLRYPLPGTVTPAGTRAEAPRGAGTGFVFVTRWTGGGLGDKSAARLTHPRSSSFAVRAWNLFCHLREHGVGTAEPMAMGEESSPLFASRSFLVTRELANMRPVSVYLSEVIEPDARRRLAHALGLFLGRIAEARVRLPDLGPDSIFVSRQGGAESCGAVRSSPVPGLTRRPLPELALTTVHGGRVLESWTVDNTREELQHLFASVDDSWQLGPRFLYRVFHHACGPVITRAEKRRAWRQLTDLRAVR
jgi:hypothetical protein